MIDARPGAACVRRDQPAADGEGRKPDESCRGRSAPAWSCRRRCRREGGKCRAPSTAPPRPSRAPPAGIRAYGRRWRRRICRPRAANSSSMARAFLRLIASPVRMTAPESISLLRETGVAIAAADEVAELRGVDRAVRQKRRQQDRRAPHDFAADHDETAGQRLRLALQGDFGEQEVRSRAADIDADRRERDVVLIPDRARDRGAFGRGLDMFVGKVGLVHRKRKLPRLQHPGD